MKFSDVPAAGITIRESATDGSDFTNPAADYRRLFLGEDGLLHVKDSAGSVTEPYAGVGDVSSDAIWDAAGDLIVGTGANAATRLAKGATGTVPTAGASTLAYAYPPGYEFDYVEYTSGDITVSGANEGAATTIVTANAVVFDGSTAVIIEFFCPNAKPSGTSGDSLLFWLYDGSSSIGRIGAIVTPAAGTDYVPVMLRRRLTPSAASHTYSIRASRGTSNGIVSNGAGGTGNVMPLYIRITKT